MKYKLMVGCIKYMFYFIAILFLLGLVAGIVKEYTWLAIILGVIGAIALVVYYIRKNNVNTSTIVQSKEDKQKHELQTPMSRTVSYTRQMSKSPHIVFDKDFSDSSDATKQVVYSFDALLDGSNTPKRQKTIASMMQDKEFEIVLKVESDLTSAYNRIYHVKYYTNSIGNLPRDICEKICNKWGQYSIQYRIRRIVILSDDTHVYSCKVWIDVFVRT